MNTATVSFNTTVRQLTEICQPKKQHENDLSVYIMFASIRHQI